ncbi:hypothetical protein FSP39_018259 [Pinctada imbricata]|uniref:PDZ domain-containing protein n=1 Tax=Pinctada imbricata TaxID=66713 RepID=A0AA88XGL9_PINIB|nr:hypothetical protein FSP39_018259 [Pinctada imbricata]
MEGEGTNLIRVKLIKQRMDGLGFLIKPRKIKPHVSVSALVAGGMAEQSGLVYVGDVVIRVNEIDVSDMSYENAVELLKALPVDAPVALLLAGPRWLLNAFRDHISRERCTEDHSGHSTFVRLRRPLLVD